MSSKQQEIQICSCQGGLENDAVDTCLCNNLPTEVIARAECSEKYCPISLCSYLKPTNIKNIKCSSENEEFHHIIAEDPVTNVLKPGSFDPDETPANDNHPYVQKTEGTVDLGKQNAIGISLFTAMKKFESNIAQVDAISGEELTYTELLKKCILVSNKLKEEVAMNDVVGFCAANHNSIVIPYLSALYNSNKVVVFDSHFKQPEMNNCLKNVTPKIMFVGPESKTLIEAAMSNANVDFKLVSFGKNGSKSDFDAYLEGEEPEAKIFMVKQSATPESAALICFDTESDETPAAFCLSHFSMLAQCHQLISSKCVFPISLSLYGNHHILWALVLFSSIIVGATRVILENQNPLSVWEAIEKYKIRSLHVYTHHLIQLAEHPEPSRNVSSLSAVFNAGERLSLNVAKRLQIYLTSAIICSIYENVEMGGIVLMFKLTEAEERVFANFKLRSVGKPLIDVLCRIVAITTEKILSHLTVGKLQVKSKMASTGTYENNLHVARTKNDWFKTNDLAHYDPYGYFYIVGGTNYLIKYKNHIVTPCKLEDVLLFHEAVDVAAVVGIPNEEDGEWAVGVVKLNDVETYANDLEKFANDQLQKSEQLKGGVKIIQSMPFTSTGKIDRNQLIRRLASGEL